MLFRSAVPTPGATAVPAAVAAAFVAVFVATLAVVFAVSFAVSLATVLAVSLAAFFAVLFASFFPASTFLIRFLASAAAFFLKSAAPLEAVPVTGRLDSYARYAACDTSCPPSPVLLLPQLQVLLFFLQCEDWCSWS